MALDLRLIGWRSEAGPADRLARLLLPVAVTGLALAISAGFLLFATDARNYATSRLFQAKLLVIALAIANALWLRASNTGERWPKHAAVAGAMSILLWLAAILLGRLVGYF